jgi:hypothetical protein
VRDPRSAIKELWEGLSPLIDPDEWPVGDWLESYGWWCIFGCNVAQRYLSDNDRQRPMGQFTNKGHEIAKRLGNWELRERLFTFEHMLRIKEAEEASRDLEWRLDEEEKQIVIGVMGRFPWFFETGLKILKSAA